MSELGPWDIERVERVLASMSEEQLELACLLFIAMKKSEAVAEHSANQAQRLMTLLSEPEYHLEADHDWGYEGESAVDGGPDLDTNGQPSERPEPEGDAGETVESWTPDRPE